MLPNFIPVQQEPTPNNWANGTNVNNWANAFSTIFGSIKGNPQQPENVTNNYNQTPPSTGSNIMKWMIGGVVFIVVVIAGVILYKISKN